MPRREYYHSNIDKCKKDNKKYYQNNKTLIKKRCKMYSDVYRSKNKEKILTANRIYKLKQFGLTKDDIEQKLKQQDYKCAICGEKQDNKSLHLDHDHQTGKIRDFLCGKCNTQILGGSKESINQEEAIKILERSILYIKKWKRDTPSL